MGKLEASSFLFSGCTPIETAAYLSLKGPLKIFGAENTLVYTPLYTKSRMFAKTGSGQTQGNLQKRRWPFSFSQVHWFIFQQWTPIYMMEELGACKKLFSLLRIAE